MKNKDVETMKQNKSTLGLAEVLSRTKANFDSFLRKSTEKLGNNT